ncbi:rhodanese-related sulfurtransferase [Chitinophaga skermanii]|uniref:Rhodanese-related sulfurtransferase n=1 Tax=Chitinophaga skermanii TaxID=331697 RepID=A0A327Q5T3_9BACT|nr:rhodanese-like domain-containing protein [Chitinophaga skermanii]RAI99895.1 rhodanese-related sulfurtransferase [Chitinophaga skermanii]
MKKVVRKLSWACLFVLASHFAKAQNKAVDIPTFEKATQQPNIQILDVRTASEFSTGHLEGALQADYTKKDEFFERIKFLDKEKPVYVYCLSGGRSAAAAKWMRSNGFANVVEMDGGINAWKQSDLPLQGNPTTAQMPVEDFDNAIKQEGYILVDVGATWCPPCRKMEPVVEAWLNTNKQVTLVKVDGGNDTDVMKYLSATKLPTFILFKGGKEVWRQEGIVDTETFDAALKKASK